MISGQLYLMDLNKTVLHSDALNVVPRELFLAEEKAEVK
jgi:hypothetical protein